MGLHEPVARLAERLRPHRRRVGGRSVPDLGRPAHGLPGRAYRALRRRVAADAHGTTSPPSPTTPSGSRLAASS